MPQGLNRGAERELVVVNIVMVLTVLFTAPDVVNYFRFSGIASHFAAISTAGALTTYVTGFLLVAFGRRWIGTFTFCLGVLVNLTDLSFLLGTKCGAQYYFIAIAVGVMFVWPWRYRSMRAPFALAGFALYALAQIFAPADPMFGPPLPSDVVDSIFRRQSLGCYAIVFALAFYSHRATERAESALEKERQQSESLLLNILPAAIAARLKRSPEAIADSFDDVSILFADVVGFTPMSEAMAPAQIVAFLNDLFSRFDRLADQYGLEKIKTIGDAYMAAAGIPLPRPDHAVVLAAMALEMMRIARETRSPLGQAVQLRIGIASGPAVAGVIGLKKFAYDIWGDTVNTASRMESNGRPGEIQVTERTFRLLQDAFVLDRRGVVEIKGKGPMELFLLRGRRLSEGRTGAAPA